MNTSLLLDLYKSTNGGLDIITELFPNIGESLNNPKKAFRLRSDERTPSAYLYPPRDGEDCWHVKDYGMCEGGGYFSPIDLYMWIHGYGKGDFRMALEELAERYGIQETLSKTVNKPIIETRDATPEEKGSMPVVDFFAGCGGIDLSCWGAGVKTEHLETYGWCAVKEVRIVYGKKVTVRKPTDAYPIFAQKCCYTDEHGQPQVFYKVYEPNNPDKAHRFLISGKKPKDGNYIYGLDVVRKVYNEGGEKKLPVLLIVSGGSDAISALVAGYYSVWLDSEVKGLSDYDFNVLKKYAERIVNIPDIDSTGINAGVQMALRHPEIYTAWLKESDMGGLHDNRGRIRKDLRDYCQLHPQKSAMDQLVNRAKTAKFWSISEKQNGVKTYEISRTSLDYFFELNGFFTIKDETQSDPMYVRIQGIKVQHVTHKAISSFLKDWMECQGLPTALRDKVLRSRDLPTAHMSTLRERDDLDFRKATDTAQYFHFRNCWVSVTAEGITRHSYNESADHYVWEENIIEHDYREMSKMFTVTTNEDGTYHVDINANMEQSNFMKFVVNASRLYWRKTDEEQLPLTDEEDAEENLSLVSKIDNVGYLLYNQKFQSEAYATICLDSTMTENSDDCNGRSGKSFYVDAISTMRKRFKIDAGNTSFREPRFLFDGVTGDTDIVFIDECPNKFNYNFIYGMVTGDFRVEEKNRHSYVIPFKQSPKFVLATNYVLSRHDPSTEGRIWPLPFSDFYHVKTSKNDYRETRTIRDDFGMELLGVEYSEHNWQLDIAFMLQCVQFHLSLSKGQRRILSSLKHIERREQLMLVGKDFKQWADDYFCEGSGNTDTMIKVDTVLADFNNETKFNWSPRTLKKHLTEYCLYSDHLHCLNPASITNKEKDGEQWRQRDENGNPKYYYYVQSEKEFLANLKPKDPEEPELPF